MINPIKQIDVIMPIFIATLVTVSSDAMNEKNYANITIKKVDPIYMAPTANDALIGKTKSQPKSIKIGIVGITLIAIIAIQA